MAPNTFLPLAVSAVSNWLCAINVPMRSVSVIVKLTGMPSKSTDATFQNTPTMEISERSSQQAYRTLICLLADFPVRHSLSPGNNEGFTIQEARSSLKSLALLGKNNHAFCCLKTSRVCYLTTREQRFLQSLPRFMNWGTTCNGKCLTAKITEYPKTERACSLVDILEIQVDQTYFPSDRLLRTLLTSQHRIRLESVFDPSGLCGTLCAQGGPYLVAIPSAGLRRQNTKRLQGFPDGWTAGLNNQQRYRCVGNAVTVTTVERIVAKLLNTGAQRQHKPSNPSNGRLVP